MRYMPEGQYVTGDNRGRNAPVIVLDCTESTNDSLRNMALEGAPSGTVLIARRQTAGRGRMSRRFESPGDGLYMSILERPGTDPAEMCTVTPLAAIALVRTIEGLTGLHAGSAASELSIKWPNDVLLDGRKICGILTELHTLVTGEDNVVSYNLIIGIGVNVNTEMSSFSEEVRTVAGSIAEFTGRRLDIDTFAKLFIREFDRLYALWEEKDTCILEEYIRYCGTIGKDIWVIDTAAGINAEGGTSHKKAAHALGINDDFSLKVIFEDGKQENINSGEVSVRVRKSNI